MNDCKRTSSEAMEDENPSRFLAEYGTRFKHTTPNQEAVFFTDSREAPTVKDGERNLTLVIHPEETCQMFYILAEMSLRAIEEGTHDIQCPPTSILFHLRRVGLDKYYRDDEETINATNITKFINHLKHFVKEQKHRDGGVFEDPVKFLDMLQGGPSNSTFDLENLAGIDVKEIYGERKQNEAKRRKFLFKRFSDANLSRLNSAGSSKDRFDLMGIELIN